jgi:hypothetical protein
MPFSTDQNIQIINAVGTWFSGCITLLALCVAYVLGTKSRRIVVNKSLGLGFLTGPVQPSPVIIHISITNINETPLTINSISWNFPKASKNTPSLLMTKFHPSSTQLPVTLGTSQTATILIEFDSFRSEVILDLIKKEIINRVGLKSIQAIAATSLGKMIKFPATSGMLVDLMELYDNTKVQKTI